MLSLRSLREQQYAYHRTEVFQDIHNWKKNPYTFLKGRFLMEFSAILVWVLQFTNIQPNILTISFALLGIFGGLLLFINPLLAVVIFFFKPILDWSDGHLARVKDKTSDFGKHLDYHAGTIGTMSFYIGVGLGHPYLLPLMLVLYFLKKLDGRARSIDLFCLFILLKELL